MERRVRGGEENMTLVWLWVWSECRDLGEAAPTQSLTLLQLLVFLHFSL